MTDLRRRIWLQGVASATLLPLLVPLRTLAADGKREAFAARTLAEAQRLWQTGTPTESREIAIVAPEVAENGARVDVEIHCALPGARTLAVFADRNPMPLCAELSFAASTVPYARLQLKLAESTRLRAVVRTVDGKTWVATREVRVVLGGCGG